MSVRTVPLSDAQAAALARLGNGETAYAYAGVSRATAAALVRLGAAEWAPAPHVVDVTRPMSHRPRYQCEWGIRRAT